MGLSPVRPGPGGDRFIDTCATTTGAARGRETNPLLLAPAVSAIVIDVDRTVMIACLVPIKLGYARKGTSKVVQTKRSRFGNLQTFALSGRINHSA